MLGTFLGLETAVSGLQAQRTALDTVAHNVANANTPGYSRQRVDMKASPALDMPGLTSATPGQIGTGVQTEQITRLRSSYLDAQYRSQNSYSGYWNTQQSTLNNISAILNEPSNTGLSTSLQNFWNAWSKLGSNPNNLSARTQVQQNGKTLAQTFNQTAQQLDKLSSNLKTSLTDNVTQANGLVSKIASLNQKIQAIQAVGDQPNDLLDQRGVLLDKLSNLATIQTGTTTPTGKSGAVSTGTNQQGQFTLSIAGTTVLQGTQVLKTITQTPSTPPTASQLAVSQIKNGVIGSTQDSINTVASYHSYLNNLANGIATGKVTVTLPTGNSITVNGLNGLLQQGYSEVNQPPNQNPAFFQAAGGGKITAGNISVGVTPSQIAAALNHQSGSDQAMPGDGTLAMAASNLANASFSFASPTGSGQTMQGTPAQYMQSIVGTLGVQSQTANQQVTNQQTLMTQINNQRQSVSGVSIDNQLADMVRYQQAYNASARMVSTINSMLKTIVNLGK